MSDLAHFHHIWYSVCEVNIYTYTYYTQITSPSKYPLIVAYIYNVNGINSGINSGIYLHNFTYIYSIISVLLPCKFLATWSV